jgi:uncharacterized protein YciI
MAGRLITSGPNKYSRPNSGLTTSQIISEFQNEQQRVNAEKNLNAEKAKKQKELQEAVRTVDRLKTQIKKFKLKKAHPIVQF